MTLKFVCVKCGKINQLASKRVSTAYCCKCLEAMNIRAWGGDMIQCSVERLGTKNYVDPKEYIISEYGDSRDNLILRIELHDERGYISKGSAVYNNYTQIKNICIAEEFERLIRWQREEAINDE